MNRIDALLAEYKAWCGKLGIATVSDVNDLITRGKTNWLINISETWHEQNLSQIARKIQQNIARKKIILISGPSSSGKTSFARRLQLHLRVLGIRAVSISLDHYYIDEADMPKNDDGKPDLEAFESIDYVRFNENLETLTEGKEAVLPVYNFGHTPNGERTLRLEQNEVIIVEGIHGLNEKLTYHIPNSRKYKIYCSAITALSRDDGTKIKSRTNRLIRRIIRDSYFRNSDYQYTLRMWSDVEAGAQKNIFPYTDSADIIFNSSLLYELAVYRTHLNKIFLNAAPTEEGFDEIQALSALVNGFAPIDGEHTPKTSLIREFIGGSTLDI